MGKYRQVVINEHSALEEFGSVMYEIGEWKKADKRRAATIMLYANGDWAVRLFEMDRNAVKAIDHNGRASTLRSAWNEAQQQWARTT